MNIRPIKTDTDLDAALEETDRLMNASPAVGSEEGDRLEVLVTLIEAYERVNFPIEAPEPIEIVRFYMEQNGLTQADLARVLGSRSRASELLSGRRTIGLSTIQAIRSHWNIPAQLLIPQMVAA